MKRKTSEFCLRKERLVSLIDAVLAIIMTLLVLNLNSPKTPTLAGFWTLHNSYFAYTLSFFWLGILWLAFNRLFFMVQCLDNMVMVLGLVMLFACSLVPYLTLLASEDFCNSLIQTFFGLCTGSVNLIFSAMMGQIAKSAKEQPILQAYIHQQRTILAASFGMKMIGIALSRLVWPPFVMISIIASTVLSVLFNHAKDKADSRKNECPGCIGF